jgi:4-amino-4-deoxy-L-arabinose transferase-like glycosyltransferase
MNQSFFSSLTLPAFFSFIILVFFVGLGSYGLLSNNEGLYAQIPLEMLQTGDWVIPHLNQEVYIEKPPLLYWLIALSYRLLGISEFSARLVPAIFGLSTCFSVFLFARKITNVKTAIAATFVLGTSFGFVIFSRMVFFDVLLTFFITSSLFSFYLWFVDEQRCFLFAFYCFLAGSILAKGLVGVMLVGLVLVVFACIERPSVKKFKAFFNPFSIALFLVIVLPWHILAALEESQFSWFYFINEHVLRFLDLREPRDYYRGSYFYYIPRLFICFLPWSFLFGFFFKKDRERNRNDRSLLTFLWGWFFSIFLFFTFSKAKANYYLVTLMPVLALLLVLKIKSFKFAEKTMYFKGACLLGLGIPFAFLSFSYFYNNSQAKMFPYLQALSAPFLITWCLLNLAGGWLILKQARLLTLFALIGGQTAGFLGAALLIAQAMEPSFSGKAIALQATQPSRNVYFYKDFEKISSILFYVRGPVKIIDSQSNDLFFAQHSLKSNKAFITADEFRKNLIHAPVWVFVFQEKIAEFKQLFPGFKIISQKGPLYLMSQV